MNIKYGICNFVLPGGGVFAPRMVSELGLDGMSLEFGEYAHGWPLSQRYIQDLYLDAQQKYGIEYPNIGVSDGDNIPFTAPAESKMGKVIRDAGIKAIDAAAYMKIPMVFFCNFMASEIKNEEDLNNTVDNYRYFCDHAAEKGVDVACELPASSALQLRLVEMVDRENFSLFYDSANHYCMTSHSSVQVLKDTYKYSYNQMHVKDGRKGENASCIVGTGDSGFKEIVEFLKQQDYSGWMILENEYDRMPMNMLSDEYIEIVKEDIRALKELTK